MCGICGKLYFAQRHMVAKEELLDMSATLIHRGPDGQGIWINRNIGLAHRRLAIIDLREEANQPMSNEDGTVWITFNGEIYNFHELRKTLESQGHVFRTQSDTETIIHAYEEYGRDCVSKLRGMFAFAIWDSRKKTLFLARDRVGKKPLYYCVLPDRFVFGSEIKALLIDANVPRQPDYAALDHFLALQYIPAPLTAFRHIKKLPAAHWVEVRDGRVHIERYWKLQSTPKRVITMPEAIEEFKWRMAEAVRLRMVSDVPLGAFLSGGIDSSAVVANMAQQTGSPVQTFCVGFQDAAFDERAYARVVAEKYGTKHTELIVQAPVTDILPKLAWHYDEPFGDSSAVPSYAIAQLTRKHVTVVLNGDGGDESFAGYDRYVTDRRVRLADRIPLKARQYLHAGLQCLPPSWRQLHPLKKLIRIAGVLAQDPQRRYARWNAHFFPEDRQQLYSQDFQIEVASSDPEGLFVKVFSETTTDNFTDWALEADVELYLVDDLLVKMDRATMAHSLEARSPFLDHQLMEFAASLPTHFKLSGSQTKALLKAAMRGMLPDSLLDRPKMGFSVPLSSWFRNELREMAGDTLTSQRARDRGYFCPDAVEDLLESHWKGQADHSGKLWDLFMLELWHQTFIDKAY
ncbi:MAG: asparagine synthetase B [Nitrospirales bacterium]|nr:MAG: asparagine synthetase B [Nitrospirales bacterium]